MKFAMNGALTIGTLDGTNIEIRDAVGAENFFLFGLTANQVRELREGSYDPRRYYESDSELRESLDGWIYGEFSGATRPCSVLSTTRFSTVMNTCCSRTIDLTSTASIQQVRCSSIERSGTACRS
jgi:glucan phosphorylase